VGSDFKADKHVHFEATFSKSNRRLVFRDLRKFGILQFMNGQATETLARLGVEAPSVSAQELFDRVQKSRRPIKSLLLDQNAIAGIGNIYADESLHLAGIHPRRLTSSLTSAEAQRLARSIRFVMKQAIIHMGTTFDGFRGVNGDSGKHARYLRVYHQTGKKCRRCGRTITKMKLAGRGTHYCPGCQKI
jgi:formamidopyrimidine-DNA glycosylase